MIPPVAAPIVTSSLDVAGLIGEGQRRALFLDRDGVINVNHGYVHMPKQTDWVPGIFDLARAARNAGFVLVVVTNQAGIARGYYTVEQFERYTRWVHTRFADEGAPLLATYYCPHHPDAGFGDLRTECDCRKPRPGMFMQAIRDFGLDPAASTIVGDSPADIQAAMVAGVGSRWLLQSDDGVAMPATMGATRIHALSELQAEFGE